MQNIFPYHYQKLALICMQMALVLSTNMMMFKKNENVLSKEFSSLCRLFIDKKLSIHFGEDKTKSMLFSRTKCLEEINISFAGYSIKQDDVEQHLGCQIYSKLSSETITSIVLRKENAKLKFLYRQNRYLTPAIRRLLYNELIQPHFNYGCSS